MSRISDEAVRAADAAYWENPSEDGDVAMRKALEAALPHLADMGNPISPPPLESIAKRKLVQLQGEGYTVNGVAIFNPETGRRGLVDRLGYVGWIHPEQPVCATPVASGLTAQGDAVAALLAEWRAAPDSTGITGTFADELEAALAASQSVGE